MKILLSMLFGGVIALSVLVLAPEYLSVLLPQKEAAGTTTIEEVEPEVLYWVAPMDANFRRDQPGQSPMGMDLVPVYENSNAGSAANMSAGVVEISAAISNNLGVKTALAKWVKPELNFISSGRVQYAKEDLVHMHARASGWIEKLYVTDIGEKVKKGQALYGLYSLELINAQEDYLRAINAQDENLIRAAKNRLTSLRVDNKVIAQLKRNKRVNQVTSFYAAQDGFIEKLDITEGMYVKPENLILSLAGFDRVVVEAEIDHRQVAWLSQYPGNIKWNLTTDLMPTKKWQGKLDYIRPTLNEDLRTLSLRLLVNNKNQLLKPNMWMKLSGDISLTEKTLVIPSSALIRTQQETRVVMAQTGNENLQGENENESKDKGLGYFKSVAVKTGRFFNQQVEILSGLQAGDKVVTSAQFLIDSESNIDSDLQRMDSTDIDASEMESSHDH
jgi:Cu(I)/Ag(I) efflux system membrane fusion protein